MDKKFLQKVIDQLVYETRIDYDEEIVYIPFFPFSRSLLSFFSHSFFHQSFFNNHCRDVYGLYFYEIEYVWKVYEHIVKDKIKNNG